MAIHQAADQCASTSVVGQQDELELLRVVWRARGMQTLSKLLTAQLNSSVDLVAKVRGAQLLVLDRVAEQLAAQWVPFMPRLC